jgi:hypothetical protein
VCRGLDALNDPCGGTVIATGARFSRATTDGRAKRAKHVFKPSLGSLTTFCGLFLSLHVAVPPVAAKEVSAPARPVRPSEAAVAALLDDNRHRPPALRAFMQRMPKGGDIHSHWRYVDEPF